MFTGYSLKLDRARHHLEELERHILAWLDGSHHTVFHEPDPDGPYERRVRVVAEPIPADPFSLLIGDALFNWRSALDHLVYGLAVSNDCTGHKSLDKSEFPIFWDKELFVSHAPNKIGLLSQAAQTIIETLQPYHRGNKYTTHPLWLLHELRRIDTHRMLHLALCNFEGAALEFDRIKNVAGFANVKVSDRVPISDTVVVRFSCLPKDSQGDMEVEFRPVLGVAFEGPPAAGENVMATLGSIHNYIVTEVLSRLEPLLSHDQSPSSPLSPLP